MRTLKLAVFLSFLFVVSISPIHSHAQAPALLNYQGRLLDGTNLVNGTTSMTFKVYNVSTAGSELYADTQTVVVVDGLYSVQIGASNTTPGALSGTLTNATVYLAVCVGATELSPRERMISVPYALVASTLSGGASAGDFVMKSGDSMSGALSNASSIAAGRYYSASNTASAAGAIALGGRSNDASAQDSTIAGGRNNRASARYATIGGGWNNSATNDRATIAGGLGNTAGGINSTIGGGNDNETIGDGATVAGGINNLAQGEGATVGGGGGELAPGNLAHGFYPTVSGGQDNQALADWSWIGGGFSNIVSTQSMGSAIGAGMDNFIDTNSGCVVIGGGGQNRISSNATFAVISGGASNTIAYGARGAVIGGGIDNVASAEGSTVGGGRYNSIDRAALHSVIAGGWSNTVSFDGFFNFIGGGSENQIAMPAFGVSPSYAVIGGGDQNAIGLVADYAVIPGGRSNTVTAPYGLAAGRRAKVNHDGSFVWADSRVADFGSATSNQFLISAAGGVGINITNGTEALTVAGNAVVTGTVTATKFIGDGSMLTGITSAPIAGIDNVIWVGTNGTASGPGTIDRPYLTPQQGYNAAAAAFPGEPSAVAIAAGQYGSLTMSSGTVHVLGVSRPQLDGLTVSATKGAILGKQRVENVVITSFVTVATSGGDVKFHNTRMEGGCVVGGSNIEFQDCYIETADSGFPALWIGGLIGPATNVGVYQSSIRNAAAGDPFYGLAFGIGALTIGIAPGGAATTGLIVNVEVIGCEIVNDSGAGAAILDVEAALALGAPVRLFAHNYIKGPPPGFGVPAVADPFIAPGSAAPTIAFNNNTVFGDLGSAPAATGHTQFYMNNSVYGLALFPGAGLVGWVQAGVGTGPDGAGNTQHEVAFPVLPSLWND